MIQAISPCTRRFLPCNGVPMTFLSRNRKQPKLLRCADSLLFLSDWCFGRRLVLSEEEAIRKACRMTGLNDFGTDLFRAPLKLICDSTHNGPPRRLLGRLQLKGAVISSLAVLLKIQAEVTRHPEILDEEIRKPIFILGAPRTGTTLLHRLLARDPAHRAPRFWEMVEPFPPPEESTYENDRRIKKYKRALALLYYCVPEFKAIHDMSDMHEPEECLAITGNVLTNPMYSAIIDGYENWYSENLDSKAVYEFHKLQLKVLQWKFKRTRWVIKSPMHVEHIASILDVYPDACIIQTHRNPQEVIASTASLFYYFMKYYYTNPFELVDGFGDRILDVIVRTLDKGLKQRKQIENWRNALFYDLSYRDFIRSPIDALRDIYDAFGFEFSDLAARRMKEYLDVTPKDKYGKHVYSLKQFGLDQVTLDSKFGNYREHFSENGEFLNTFICGGNRIRRHFV